MSIMAGLFGKDSKSESKSDLTTAIPNASAPPVQVMGRSVSNSDRGECRICFEKGGDLIAPCLCDGTSKWIHRGCLDQWRVSGVNPRALTNCPSCGFQYHLKLKRILSDDGDERRRQFLQRLAGQTILAFMGVQLAIIGLGMLIRLGDQQEELVTLLHLPQDPGYEDFSGGSYMDALRHHKLTYYICGLLAFLALIGFAVMGMGCAALCFGTSLGSRPRSRRVDDDVLCCMVCMDTCRCGLDCGLLCGQECCCAPCTGRCRCPAPPTQDCNCNSNGGENVLVLVVVVVVAAVVIGIIAAAIAAVMTTQQAIKRYARLEEMHILSQEYVVVDLANPNDSKDETVICRAMDREEQNAQRQAAQDLSRIFAYPEMPLPSAPHHPSYGAAEP